MRRHMYETEQFEKNVAKAKAIKNPLMLTLREYPKSVAQLIGLTLLSTLCYYTFFSTLTPFAVKGNGLDDSIVFWALSIATALFVVLQYPFGWTADHFGRKPQLLVWSGAIALLIVPVSALIHPEAGFGSVLLVFCFGLGLYAMKSSIAPAIMSELFPTRLRGLGIGAWYNLTVALFGGTAPLVIQWLSNIGHSSWFFWYVAVGAAVAFVATLTLPETKGSVLR
jgi:MHS family alpha-ketoglutarate permease-like MFS transporter